MVKSGIYVYYTEVTVNENDNIEKKRVKSKVDFDNIKPSKKRIRSRITDKVNSKENTHISGKVIIREYSNTSKNQKGGD